MANLTPIYEHSGFPGVLKTVLEEMDAEIAALKRIVEFQQERERMIVGKLTETCVRLELLEKPHLAPILQERRMAAEAAAAESAAAQRLAEEDSAAATAPIPLEAE